MRNELTRRAREIGHTCTLGERPLKKGPDIKMSVLNCFVAASRRAAILTFGLKQGDGRESRQERGHLR